MSSETMTLYVIPALVAVLGALAGWLGNQLRKLADKYINDKTKRAVARTCVKAVEQLYHDLNGEDKLQKAIEAAAEMLEEKGIGITELELRMNIEEVVAEFNYGFGPKDAADAEPDPGEGTEEEGAQ